MRRVLVEYVDRLPDELRGTEVWQLFLDFRFGFAQERQNRCVHVDNIQVGIGNHDVCRQHVEAGHLEGCLG
jgi:hypothetical protein